MERNNRNDLKDHSLGENYYYNNNNNKDVKSPWEYCSSSSRNYGEDYNMGHGFSWPPRSYICSFCKREFKSAQALGGHMNVHRRDRARLRVQSPPRDINLNLNPNPSPNPNPSFLTTPPPSTMLHPSFPTTCILPSLVSPSCSSASSSHHEIKKSRIADGALVRNLSPKGTDLTRTKAVKYLFKEDVDLELRLGYS